jgi:hypothetical protein
MKCFFFIEKVTENGLNVRRDEKFELLLHLI